MFMWRRFLSARSSPDGESDSGSGSVSGAIADHRYSPCEEHGYDLALSHDQMRHSLLPASGRYIASILVVPMRQTAAGAGFTPAVRSTGRNVTHEQRFRRLNSQQPEVAEQL